VIGVGAFKRHTRMLVNMSDGFIENRNVWIKCSYNKARNDYIKTRDNITDSVVFHFDSDCDVADGDVLLLSGARYLISSLVPDTFFTLVMRKRAAGVFLNQVGNLYSAITSYDSTEGESASLTLKSSDVWFAMQREPFDGTRHTTLPYDALNILMSSNHGVQLGDVLDADIGRYYISGIDRKIPGISRILCSTDGREYI